MSWNTLPDFPVGYYYECPLPCVFLRATYSDGSLWLYHPSRLVVPAGAYALASRVGLMELMASVCPRDALRITLHMVYAGESLYAYRLTSDREEPLLLRKLERYGFPTLPIVRVEPPSPPSIIAQRLPAGRGALIVPEDVLVTREVDKGDASAG